MIPIVIDPATTSLALIGRGDVAGRRLEALLDGGAKALTVYSDQPSAALIELAADRLRPYLPSVAELAWHRVVWIADLPLSLAIPLAEASRSIGVLVNVEDVKPFCDFHNPSIVRRRDLLLTVSTGGKSPGLATRIRRRLERLFGEEWADRLDQIGAKRTAWRRRARSLAELARLTDALIDRNGWLGMEERR